MRTISVETDCEPRRRFWTLDEYHCAAEVGIFRPDERLELIEGEVTEKMRPQGEPHVIGVVLTADALQNAFPVGCYIRQEKPLVLNDRTEPEPDVVVVRGTPRQLPRRPTVADAVLVVEVSDSTLAFDQNEKAAAYARSGVADYWIVNIPALRLEVRRDPGPLEANHYGYRALQILLADGQASPLAAPEAIIRVADLLPITANVEENAP